MITDQTIDDIKRIAYDALHEEQSGDMTYDFKVALQEILHLIAPNKYDEEGELI